jgi:type II secretory pathway predicted ATPase ExeA
MYESFFELKQRPFAAAPRVDRYFTGAAIEGSRLALSRAIERAEGAGILIGAAGTGKTLLCHLLAEQFRGSFAVAMLSNGHLDTRRELLQAVLFELGLPYRRLEEGELRLSLIDYISSEQTARNGLLLILDEAHTLSPRLLEEVRLIGNVVRHGQPRVRLVLAGNPALEESLADPQLEAFSQRVATRCYLHPLDYSQTRQYVLWQMALGAEARDVFTPDALEAIYRATDGIPRLINQVCDHALMLAFAGGRRQIDRAGLEEAWSDLQQLPTPWVETPSRAASSLPSSGSFIEFGDLGEEPPTSVSDGAAFDKSQFESAGELGPAAEATLLLHQIDDHLSELQRDFTSEGPTELRTRQNLSADPFNECFDEEEVLVDRYSSPELNLLSDSKHVESAEGRAISKLLGPLVQSNAYEFSLISEPPGDERSIAARSVAAALGWTQSTTVDSLAVFAASTLEVGVNSDPPVPQDGSRHVDPANDDAHDPLALAFVGGAEERFSLYEDPTADDDLMIIEDDPQPEIRAHSPPRARQVRRQEYRQLFSSLRRG